MSNCRIGGIVKHRNGYGFKVTFTNKKHANKYKDMLFWIICNDNISTVKNVGYHDLEEYQI